MEIATWKSRPLRLGCMEMRFGHDPTGGKEENPGAVDIELTPDDVHEIESAFSKITVQRSLLSDAFSNDIEC